MLKKLRLKFIALNMATVAAVLVVVFTTICVINYQQQVNSVYNALNSAIERDAAPHKDLLSDVTPPYDTLQKGGSTDTGADASSGATNGSASSSAADGATDSSNAAATNGATDSSNAAATDGATDGGGAATNAPFEIGGKKQDGQFIPVAVYQINQDGTLESLSASTTASIADDVLEQAAKQLSERNDGSGLLDDLRLYYVRHTNANGDVYLAFADKSSADGWQSLALTLTGVGVAALLAFLVISLFFSRWALRPVEQAWTQQRRFVADASHELKTPLTVILANTSILLEHPERSVASQGQWVESTQTEAERMQQLVGDLLALARLDEPAVERAQERIDLADLVEGELLQFESVAFERSVSLEADIEADVTVLGDAARLHRLASTLIDNACKYADDGGQVSVSLKRHGKQAILSVHNTGPAIAPEDLPHVFDRFYRADKARTRDDGGYGLGLAIAYAVAEEHGGTLEASSSENAGTTFTATLPLTL